MNININININIMNICIILRGENIRYPVIDRKYIDILQCWNNIKKTIYDDLIQNNYNCDFAFVTYPSEIIEKIQETIKPKYMILNEKISQIHNFNDVISFMKEHEKNYDKFVILRCDFTYRIPITKWPKWDEKGIIIVNKDVHWNTMKLYSDILFICDSNYIDIFYDAYNLEIFNGTLHSFGKNLLNMNKPFHLMYDDYYHMNNHPLHCLASQEEEPDINNPKYIEPLTNEQISQFN